MAQHKMIWKKCSCWFQEVWGWTSWNIVRRFDLTVFFSMCRSFGRHMSRTVAMFWHFVASWHGSFVVYDENHSSIPQYTHIAYHFELNLPQVAMSNVFFWVPISIGWKLPSYIRRISSLKLTVHPGQMGHPQQTTSISTINFQMRFAVIFQGG